MTIGLTILAFTMSTDFTMCGALMFVLSFSLTLVTIIFVFFGANVPYWHPYICGLFVALYGLFLIYDTQQIAGGRKYQLSLDDYVIGALLVYVDIIMIFV